ncbi:integrase catalytic domain-containing protein [Trichonephila clavipes]|nr:integrase catalytic domain-containing protein [Trichonephila clavipes]
MNKSVREGEAPPFLETSFNLCRDVRTHRRKSACVEVGSTHKHLQRGVNSNNFKNYFSSNDITCEETVLWRVRTLAKLKTKIENSSTFESDPDFVKTLIQNCIDERVSRNEREVTLEKQKIELAKLQLAKLEKEVELQTAKNKALSLNPAAKVEDKQFETNIENMINSIRTISSCSHQRSENFNLFFQSLERAFLTKKINEEYKSEILINLLGERAHNVLLYIKEELNDYEKLKSIVLREFQLTPRECLNSFKNAVKSSGETYIQFAARLTANFQYYCSLRKVNSFESM